MTLPAHIIEHLNSADERKQQAVLDATITARYEERDRFRDERELMHAAVKVFDLMYYDPFTDEFKLSVLSVMDHNLGKFFRDRRR